MECGDNTGFTKDGSASLRKKPVLRARTGGWKACSLILVFNSLERIVFFGIQSNLMIYMTNNLHEGTVNAANNVNNWAGATWLTTMLGAYLSDSYLGHYWAVCVFAIVYVLGMMLLVTSVTVPSLKPHPCKLNGHCDKPSALETGMFFAGLYAIAVASGSTRPNLSTFGAEQFDEFDEKEKLQKASFFNWWMFSVFLGQLLGQTFGIYIQENVGFDWGYGFFLIVIIFALAIFLLGTPLYRHKWNKENPFKEVAQVVVAAACKWTVPLPSDPSQFHELEPNAYSSVGRRALPRTPTLRFLDKAAIKDASAPRPWRLCTVTQVEETKLLAKLIPALLHSLVPFMLMSPLITLFIKQGRTLRRKIGPHFEVPAGSLTALVTVSMITTIVLYERLLIAFLRKVTGNPRGLTPLQRMGLGYTIQVIAMVAASLADARTVNVITEHRLSNQPKSIVPLSVFTLVPQFAVIGIAAACFEPALLGFFYDESPHNLKSSSTSLFFFVIGISFYLSSLLLTFVNRITGKFHGHLGWVQDNLNSSKLYCYYALLAALGSFNLLFFVLVSQFHTYRSPTP